MLRDIDRVLIDRETIARRVKDLAAQITRDIAPGGIPGAGAIPGGDDGPEPGEITIVPILTGSFIFVADLIRHLPILMNIRLASVSSYPGTATTSRGAALDQDLSSLPVSFANTHVLLVDDILDSGRTLRLMCDELGKKNPASLRSCVLLRKKRPEAMAFQVDYVAFDIPDEFVVGYGLDFNGYYRNLPDIVTLRPELIDA